MGQCNYRGFNPRILAFEETINFPEFVSLMKRMNIDISRYDAFTLTVSRLNGVRVEAIEREEVKVSGGVVCDASPQDRDWNTGEKYDNQ